MNRFNGDRRDGDRRNTSRKNAPNQITVDDELDNTQTLVYFVMFLNSLVIFYNIGTNTGIIVSFVASLVTSFFLSTILFPVVFLEMGIIVVLYKIICFFCKKHKSNNT